MLANRAHINGNTKSAIRPKTVNDSQKIFFCISSKA